MALESAIENSELLEGVIKECNKDLRNLNATLKIATNRSMKSSLANTICMLNSFRTKMKFLRLKVGSGYKQCNANKKNYVSTRVNWVELESAFGSRVRTGAVVNLSHKEPRNFLEDCYKLFNRRTKNLLKRLTALKVNAVFCGLFKIVKNGKEVTEFKYLNTKNNNIYPETNLKQWFDINILEEILKNLDEFQEKDSGWALASIVNLTINFNKYSPQLGSTFIELPHEIDIKKACINVQNSDNKCFKWAVLSALHPQDANAHRVAKYQSYAAELNFTGINFPMTMKQIPR